MEKVLDIELVVFKLLIYLVLNLNSSGAKVI
jgi:hypothetical protein